MLGLDKIYQPTVAEMNIAFRSCNYIEYRSLLPKLNTNCLCYSWEIDCQNILTLDSPLSMDVVGRQERCPVLAIRLAAGGAAIVTTAISGAGVDRLPLTPRGHPISRALITGEQGLTVNTDSPLTLSGHRLESCCCYQRSPHAQIHALPILVQSDYFF